uniref:Mitochondrial import inner membrane translocase subunit TIM14 n=1 Tax=Pseudonaja textilis TaxID=8673 RepID=A0A670ZQZ8_PSETE
MIVVGLTIAAAGYAGRYALQAMKQMEPQVKQTLQSLPKTAFSGYYRGGFESKMNKREAALILGVSPTANKAKIREAHRRIMLLNHPDKGSLPVVFQNGGTESAISRLAIHILSLASLYKHYCKM